MIDDLKTLTPAEALSVLKASGSVHCFRNPGVNILIGANWTRTEIGELLRTSSRIELSGPEARRMKHGLVVFYGNDPCFFETDEQRLAAFEIEKSTALRENGEDER